MLAIPSRKVSKGLRRKATSGGFSPCIVCGAGVRDAIGAWTVRVHMGGSHAVTEAEAESLNMDPDWRGGDLGQQFVGAKCLALFPELKPYARRIK